MELGFEFKKSAAKLRPKKRKLVDLPFERRVEQLRAIQEEMDINDIDWRYHKWHNLGGWCADISRRYKDWQEGKAEATPVEEDQFNQLSELGFRYNIFVGRNGNRPWEENFKAFLQFQKDHGHSNVPCPYKKDVRLSTWVGLMRNDYKALREGKKSRMTQEKIDKLVDAGFIWETKGGRGAPKE